MTATPLRRFGVVDFVLFLYVLVMAGGVRAGYLMLAADNGKSSGPLAVQDQNPVEQADQEALADSVQAPTDKKPFFSSRFVPLADKRDKEDEAPTTAHASPGYPVLLGLLEKAVSAKDQRDLIVRWSQCGLGALTAGFYFLFARRAFRSMTAGLLTGLLCALYPFWVVNTAEINDGVLAAFLVSLVLSTGARASQTGDPFSSVIYGLALAGTALVRAALLPFAFVGLAWFLLRSRKLPSGWLAALLGFLGFVIGVAPWTVRNWQEFHEPIPIVDSAYLHVWMGNNPQADGGPVNLDAALSPETIKELKAAPEKEQPKRYAGLGRIVLDDLRAIRRPWRSIGSSQRWRFSSVRPAPPERPRCTWWTRRRSRTLRTRWRRPRRCFSGRCWACSRWRSSVGVGPTAGKRSRCRPPWR